MKRILVPITAFFLMQAVAHSEILFWWNWDCSNGATSYTTGIKDDKTGKAFVLFVDCDGNTCICPFDGGAFVKVGELAPPPNFHGMCQGALATTTPNTRVLFMFNGSTGDSAWFRTPVNQMEREEYWGIWHDMSQGLTIMTSPEQKRRYADTLQNALVRTYREAQLRAGGGNVIVSTSGSTVTISPANGESASNVTIYDRKKRSVWHGYVGKPVTLSLPAGIYRVRGFGGSYVVGVGTVSSTLLQ